LEEEYEGEVYHITLQTKQPLYLVLVAQYQ